MRRLVAVALLVTACSLPVPSASSAPEPSAAAASPSASPTNASATPAPTASATPSPSGVALAVPVSAGAVPDAGTLYFSDYGPPEGPQGLLASRALYRYDGATGAVTRMPDGPLSGLAVVMSTGIAFETAAGVYLRGIQGRWDLLHWDGTRAGDDEFTACQASKGHFASWCTVTPKGIGLGYGTHVGPPCGAPAFIRFPGETAGRPLPADLCIGSAWVNDGGSVVVASGFVRTGSAASGCPGDQFEIDGTCHRRTMWVVPTGGTPRTLVTPALPGVNGVVAISPDGRSAAAQHFGSLFLVDLASGAAVHLGAGWSGVSWSADGRLVFVRGSGRESWSSRTVVVATADGKTTEVLGYKPTTTMPIGLAPVWDPAGGRLAWVASPTSATASATYEASTREHLSGTGVGDRRVLVGGATGDPTEYRCGEGVAEGVRWSPDGSALLLLCRRPGTRVNAYELWMQKLDGSRSVPLVRGLTLGGVDPYGVAPSLLDNTAWSRGLDIARR